LHKNFADYFGDVSQRKRKIFPAESCSIRYDNHYPDQHRALMMTSFSIKRLIYLFLVTGVAFAIQFYSTNPQSYWVVWSALTLAMIMSGNTFSQRLLIIVLTGIAIACLSFIAAAIAKLVPLLALFYFFVTLVCVYMAQQKPKYFFPLFLINLFTMVAGLSPVTLTGNIDRIIYIFAGTMTVLFFQMIFWPHFIRNEIRTLIKMILRNLIQLNKEIFSCFLQPEYPENIYLFERRLHHQKKRYLQLMGQLRLAEEIIRAKEQTESRMIIHSIITRLEFLYDIMLDYAQLRRRVNDHTIFAVCADELSAIANEIDKIFLELIALFAHKNPLMDATGLEAKIKWLDESYHHILQVASREPLVFLLFITSLRFFHENLTTFYNEALKARAVLN
jgi:hypothetical protein